MKYKQFMKPMVILMQVSICFCALANVFLIGTEYSIGYYLINVIWLIFLLHVGLKLYEIFIIAVLRLIGKDKDFLNELLNKLFKKR